jgi:hypothetical protein
MRSGTRLWCGTLWLTLPNRVEVASPGPQEPTTMRSSASTFLIEDRLRRVIFDHEI